MEGVLGAYFRRTFMKISPMGVLGGAKSDSDVKIQKMIAKNNENTKVTNTETYKKSYKKNRLVPTRSPFGAPTGPLFTLLRGTRLPVRHLVLVITL